MDVLAYIDGPYGCPPDFNAFDHIILFGAGAGVTFILPIALSAVRKGRVRTVDFVWTVKTPEHLEIIRDQLLELDSHTKYGEGTAVNMRLHLTGKEVYLPPTPLERLRSIATFRQPRQQLQYHLSNQSALSMVPETSEQYRSSYAESEEDPRGHRRVFSADSQTG